MRKPYTPLVLLLAVGLCPLYAQDVTNLSFAQDKSNIIITYDLGESTDALYTIEPFFVTDTGKNPIVSATGDLGTDISGGKRKTIVWKAINDLQGYKGGLKIEIKSTVTFAPLIPISTMTGQSVKSKKSVELQWKGGLPNEYVTATLYSNDRLIKAYDPVKNTGKATLELPKGLLPHNEYEFRLTGGNSQKRSSANQPIHFGRFLVKKSNGAMISALGGGAVLAGALVYFLISADPAGGEKDDPGLPDFPALPEN